MDPTREPRTRTVRGPRDGRMTTGERRAPGARAPRRGRRPRGQSLVEFALVLPIFLLAFFAILDGARLVFAYNRLSEAAREGARVAAVEAPAMGSSDAACVTSATLITDANPGARVCPANAAALKADVVAAVDRSSAGLGPVSDVYLACNAGAAAGDPAPTGEWTEATVDHPQCTAGTGVSPNASGQLTSVRVVYTFTPVTPIVGQIIGSLPISGAATMVIN